MLAFALLVATVSGLRTVKWASGESQLQQARNAFSMDCKMTLDTKKQIIHLKTSKGDMQFTAEGLLDANGKNIGTAPPMAFICQADTNPKNGSMAILTQATSTSYLFGSKNGGQWKGLANKYCYAKQHNLGMFLWVGEVAAEAKELLLNRPPDALPCHEGAPSNHYFKSVALKAILDERPNVGTIVTMDLDAWIAGDERWDVNMEKEFFSGPEDIIAGQSSGPRLVSSATLGFKNTPIGREVLADWFKNRCGAKDQLSLWNALLKQFAIADPTFKYNQGKMSAYGEATKYAISAVANHWPEYNCKSSYRNGWTVEKPVHLPHMVIHPNAKGSKALLYAIGGSQVCHVSNTTPERVNSETRCSFDRICAEPKQCQCTA